MRLDRDSFLLYAVTDRAWTGRQSLYEQVESALSGGITLLQLREKNMSDEAFLEEAVRIKKLCDDHQVPLIINDRVDVALKCGAAGVHLGQEDGNVREVREKVGDRLLIGVSAHNVKEALLAQEQGADYLGVGAVFGSSTKTDAHPLEHAELRKISHAVSIPVVAIGGITRENVTLLKGTGISGAALISAIFAAHDIEKECRELKEILRDISLDNRK